MNKYLQVVAALIVIITFPACQLDEVPKKATLGKKPIVDTAAVVSSDVLQISVFSTNNLKIHEVKRSSIQSGVFDGLSKTCFEYMTTIHSRGCFFSKAGEFVGDRNFISFGEQQFFFNKIFNRFDTNSDRQSSPEVSKVIEIETKAKKKYIAVFCKDMNYNSYYWNEMLFLFSIGNDKVKRAFYLDDTMFITPKVFGDYNDDGILDYIKFSKGIDSIFCYQITDAGISKLDDRFIEVETLDGIGQAFKVRKVSPSWMH
ncbi:hypothetical protein LZZ85_05590 [Terrimonas sp. NA20]|uniref:VCBS repeat-containing protein n=1 Tax=Terrimonas ginsenosidimutans TaxID=2908004 RepID=A0ABS9KN78_9BACT|nr:hypothetical protein [Terrimonas ginsenosidimutans]MCG2613740.1 hypothetical protein [Terrimonas ginsenosidimutans]